jgi:hypothetical protein
MLTQKSIAQSNNCGGTYRPALSSATAGRELPAGTSRREDPQGVPRITLAHVEVFPDFLH